MVRPSFALIKVIYDDDIATKKQLFVEKSEKINIFDIWIYRKLKYRNIDIEKIPVFIDISQQPSSDSSDPYFLFCGCGDEDGDDDDDGSGDGDDGDINGDITGDDSDSNVGGFI